MFQKLGFWILDSYNVRLEMFKSELSSDLRFSSQRNLGKTKEQSTDLWPKRSLISSYFGGGNQHGFIAMNIHSLEE